MNWSSLRLTCAKLQQLGYVLGGQKTAAILRNYTVSYKFWNHGMADLILWNVKTDKIKFSEVKSTNDRLSET